MTASIELLANNGTVGGGEVMMVALGVAARALGVDVRVVAPWEPSDTTQLARDSGLDVLVIPGENRRSYVQNLALHRRRLDGDLWWCNGLVPAVATAGTSHRRVVHLHQEPTGAHRRLWQVAQQGVERVFVPSQSMHDRIPGSTVLWNWTDDLALLDPPPPIGRGPVRVGFIGRFSPIKGLDVLARAMQRLDRTIATPLQLVLAGDNRFVADQDAARVDAEVRRVREVERLGWVPREEFFGAIDVVVVPSVWAEPFGLVAAEAMAFGRPVVVSDAGALCEVVGPEHPWVARADDVVDTARILRRFLEEDSDARWQQCLAARKRWEAEFSPGAGKARVAAALEELGLIDGPLRHGAEQ